MFEPKPANHYDNHDGRDARPDSPRRCLSAEPLNVRLYAALAAVFFSVRVTNPGMPSTVGCKRSWVGSRPRNETQVSPGGEHYAVCCPFCGDTRGRLSIHHLWGTPDPTTRRPMWFLANCFNEGCLRNTGNQRALAVTVFPNCGSTAVVPLSGSTVATPRMTSTLSEIALPENFVRLDDKDCPRHARDYVASRGFDFKELAAQWGVGYSAASGTPAPRFGDRLVIPCRTLRTANTGEENREVYHCGWQARRLDDSTESKYLTSAGMPVSRFLYGFYRVDHVKAGLVVLVEGVTDVWRLGTPAVALLGKSLSEQQKRQICRLNGVPLVVFLDAGAETEAAQICDSLRRHRVSIGDSAPVTIAVPLQGRKDPGECSYDEAWDQVAKALEWSRAELQKRMSSGSLPPSNYGDLPIATVARPSSRRSRVTRSKNLSAKTGSGVQTINSTASVSEGLSAAKSRVRSLVAEIERKGILIDVQALDADIADREQTIRRLQSAIDQFAGHHVSARNPQQIAELVHTDLGIPVHHGRSDGTPKIDVPTLNALGKSYPIATQIAQMLKETHRLAAASELSRSVVKSTNLIHPILDSEGTVTGRFTCHKPSLLSLPKCLRYAVIARPGHMLMVADFQQFELRILAMLSGDKRLSDVFRRGGDPHAATASALFPMANSSMTSEQRRIGKQVNFSVINGQTPHALCQILGSTVTEAHAWIDDFFAEYAGARRWIDNIESEVRRTGAVTTAFGRRRLLPDAQSHDGKRVKKALRQAVSTAVQGTAAEVFQIVLCRLHRLLPRFAHILLPLHDGVLIEFPERDVDRIRRLVQQAMTMPLPRGIELPIQVTFGGSWGGP